MKKIFIFPIALFFCSLPRISLGAEKSVDLLERLTEAMAGVSDLSASFTQTTTVEAAGMEKSAGGTVVFKRGSRMRWEYKGSDPQTIVCDGKTLWVYQPRDRTALKRPLGELAPSARAALDLLSGASQAGIHFNLSSCGNLCVELKPKKPDPDLSAVRLLLGDEGRAITEVTTEDAVGNRTRIVLSGIEKNKGVEDRVFDFTPPPGVDVFDGQGRAR